MQGWRKKAPGMAPAVLVVAVPAIVVANLLTPLPSSVTRQRLASASTGPRRSRGAQRGGGGEGEPELKRRHLPA